MNTDALKKGEMGDIGRPSYITAVCVYVCVPFNVEALGRDTIAAATVLCCESSRIFLLHCICKFIITCR